MLLQHASLDRDGKSVTVVAAGWNFVKMSSTSSKVSNEQEGAMAAERCTDTVVVMDPYYKYEVASQIRYDEMEKNLQEHAEKFRKVLEEMTMLPEEAEKPKTSTPISTPPKVDELIERSMDIAVSLDQMRRDVKEVHEYIRGSPAVRSKPDSGIGASNFDLQAVRPRQVNWRDSRAEDIEDEVFLVGPHPSPATEDTSTEAVYGSAGRNTTTRSKSCYDYSDSETSGDEEDEKRSSVRRQTGGHPSKEMMPPQRPRTMGGPLGEPESAIELRTTRSSSWPGKVQQSLNRKDRRSTKDYHETPPSSMTPLHYRTSRFSIIDDRWQGRPNRVATPAPGPQRLSRGEVQPNVKYIPGFPVLEGEVMMEDSPERTHSRDQYGRGRRLENVPEDRRRRLSSPLRHRSPEHTEGKEDMIELPQRDEKLHLMEEDPRYKPTVTTEGLRGKITGSTSRPLPPSMVGIEKKKLFS